MKLIKEKYKALKDFFYKHFLQNVLGEMGSCLTPFLSIMSANFTLMTVICSDFANLGALLTYAVNKNSIHQDILVIHMSGNVGCPVFTSHPS